MTATEHLRETLLAYARREAVVDSAMVRLSSALDEDKVRAKSVEKVEEKAPPAPRNARPDRGAAPEREIDDDEGTDDKFKGLRPEYDPDYDDYDEDGFYGGDGFGAPYEEAVEVEEPGEGPVEETQDESRQQGPGGESGRGGAPGSGSPRGEGPGEPERGPGRGVEKDAAPPAEAKAAAAVKEAESGVKERVTEAVREKTEAAEAPKRGEKAEAPGAGVETKRGERGAIAPSRLGSYLAQQEAKAAPAPQESVPAPDVPGAPAATAGAPAPEATAADVAAQALPPEPQGPLPPEASGGAAEEVGQPPVEVPSDFPSGGAPSAEEEEPAVPEKRLGADEESELRELDMDPEVIPQVAIGSSVVDALGDVTQALEAATAAVEYADGGDFGPELQELQALADQATNLLSDIKRKASAKVQQASEDYGKRQVQQGFYARMSAPEA